MNKQASELNESLKRLVALLLKWLREQQWLKKAINYILELVEQYQILKYGTTRAQRKRMWKERQ